MLRALILTVYLVGAMAAPAFGQPAGRSAEPKLRQDIEAVFSAWLDAINRGGGKTAAAFFLPDAQAINPQGGVIARMV